MKKQFSAVYKFTVFLMLSALLTPIFTVGANAQAMQKTSAKPLTEDQKILHVLNRLGFGARSGDIERVRAMGLNKYIEQQLNPASIDDSVADAKVKNLDVLKMSNEELFAKYPNGQAVLRMIAQREGLNKGDVAQLRKKNQVKGADENAMQNDGAMVKEDGAAMTKPDAAKSAVDPNDPKLSDADRARIQKEVADIYRENNLGRPQQISQQLSASRIMRAVYSERQLNEQMVDFWTNHFNVYSGKAATRWFLPEYDRDVIRPNAMGNFKDLLLATAKSPAMLFYLDNFQSISPKAQTNNNRAGGQRLQQMMRNGNLNPQMRQRIKDRYGVNDAQLDERMKQMRANPQANQNKQKKQQRGINENYAREIMELHTLGVDGGYTLKDIQEIARCFTGWTIFDPRGYRKFQGNDDADNKRIDRLSRLAGVPDGLESGAFYFNERFHDGGEKIVLGQKINEGGMKDGLKVIDILVNHPSTAKFIARKLAVKFVSDNPSDALVQRVADAFHNSKGDIKTTLRALFTDKEFFAPENYRAKIKTPFELTVSAIRAVGADTNGGAVQALLAKMGEPLYGYITPNGYPDMAEDWVNTGALLERMNYAVALASNRIPGTRVNLSRFEGKNKQEILDKAIATVLGGEVAPNTRAMLLKQIEQPLPEPKIENVSDDAAMENDSMMNQKPGQIGGGKRAGGGQQARLLAPSGNAEVFKVVGLILGSPDFQRQ
ncbi:MAG: DUF1800 domain-containing protein [Acidobacteriota bacterium]|nr:DUF1800 domain-containing protein [Acidobacteriota bacterium]